MLGRFGYAGARATNLAEIERAPALARAAPGTRWKPHFRKGRPDRRPRWGDCCLSAQQHRRPVSRRREIQWATKRLDSGSEAAKLGNVALRRLSKEVEHRPACHARAVAVGVGIIVGLASAPSLRACSRAHAPVIAPRKEIAHVNRHNSALIILIIILLGGLFSEIGGGPFYGTGYYGGGGLGLVVVIPLDLGLARQAQVKGWGARLMKKPKWLPWGSSGEEAPHPDKIR